MKRKHSSDDGPSSTTTTPQYNYYTLRPLHYYESLNDIRLQKPKQVGCYSQFHRADQNNDDDNDVEFNQKAFYPVELLRSPPPSGRDKKLNMNLLDGFVASKVTPDDNNQHPAPLTPVLQTLKHSFSSSCSSSSSTNRRHHHPLACHIITFRNNMNKLLGTPYNPQKEWQFSLYKYKTTMIWDVERSPSEKKQNQIDDMPLYQKQCIYAGRRFEQYATNQPPNEEYCTVVQTRLGPWDIILAAELDGYHPRTHHPVELKTTRLVERDKDRVTLERYKFLSFWIQSYLVGVPSILCAFRDVDFRVVKTSLWETEDLPLWGRRYWTPRVCLAFANEVVGWLYGNTREGGFYRVRYCPESQKIEMSEIGDEPLPEFDLSFLD